MKKIQSATKILVGLGLLAATVACGEVAETNFRVPATSVAELAQQDRCYLDSDGQLNADCLPARTEADWKVFVKSNDTSRVRSMKGWKGCLKRMRCNPLKRFKRSNPELITQFTQSLVFRKKALAGADYSMLVNELSYREFKNLWAVFGISGPVFVDHQGYACVGQGDCERDSDHICTSNC